MTSLFSRELLANPIFKWEELAGKELLIRVGSVPDELGKGMHLTVNVMFWLMNCGGMENEQ